MMLTTKSRYAVMAIIDIAVNSKNETIPVSLKNVTARQNIPLNYLEQLFMKLKEAGLVKAVRGPGGGYIINKPLNELTIFEIIAAVDESVKMTRCDEQEERGCVHHNSKCITHKLWLGLGQQITNYLSSVTVDDVKNNNIMIKNIDVCNIYEQDKKCGNM